MAEGISGWDILQAIEPTGFWQNLPEDEAAPWTQAADPLTILATCFFLFLGFLVHLLWKFRITPLKRRAKELTKLTSTLKTEFLDRLPIKNEGDWKNKVWPQVNKVHWLKATTTEFEEQCWVDKNDLVRNAHQAGDYFTEETLDPGSEGFGGATPGLLTAVGILGTFVGITVGLGQIGGGLSETDLTDTIVNLVKALGVSFRTSIWGLLFSMFSTWRLTRAEGRFDMARLEFVAWLDNALERGTEHDLLQDLDEIQTEQLSLLKELAGIGEDQKGEIQSLAEQMSQAFEEVILGRPTESGDRIGGLAQLITKNQSEGVGEMVTEFRNQLHDELGGQFQNLGRSIETMVEANDSYKETMGGLVTELANTTGAQAQAAANMTTAVGAASTAIGEIRETVTALSTSANDIQTAASTVGSMLTRQSEVATQQQNISKDLASGLEAQKQGWAEHQRVISETYNSMEGKFAELRDALVALTDWHDRVKDQLNEQLRTWQGALQTQETLTQTIADERSGVSTMLDQLKTVTTSLAGMKEGLERLAQQLEQDLDKVSTSRGEAEQGIRTASEDLTNAGKAMRDSWKEYVQVATALTESLPNITGLLEGIRQSVSMQQDVVSAGGQVADQLERTASSQDTIRQSFEAIALAGDATSAALLPAARAIQTGAQTLETAVVGLQDVHASTDRLATTMDQTATRLETADAESRRSWEQVTSAVNRTTAQLTDGMTEYSRRVNTNLSTTLDAFDTELGSAVEALGQAIFNLLDLVNTIQVSQERQSGSKPPDENEPS